MVLRGEKCKCKWQLSDAARGEVQCKWQLSDAAKGAVQCKWQLSDAAKGEVQVTAERCASGRHLVSRNYHSADGAGPVSLQSILQLWLLLSMWHDEVVVQHVA